MEPLFVYGTLRRGFDNRFARLLSQSAGFLGKARIRGRLYRIRHYPGLKLSTDADEWVTGEVYGMSDSVSLLPALDAYEGDDYRRTWGSVTLESGGESRAWVYVYTPPVDEERRIASGDFLDE